MKTPPGWKGTGSSAWRQWKVVGELMPEKHQKLIDELMADVGEDDPDPTLEAYFINSELWDMIDDAPKDMQPRTIEIAMEEDDGNEADDDEEDEDEDED